MAMLRARTGVSAGVLRTSKAPSKFDNLNLLSKMAKPDGAEISVLPIDININIPFAEQLLTALGHIFGYDREEYSRIVAAKADAEIQKISARSEAETKSYQRRLAQGLPHFPPKDSENIGKVLLDSVRLMVDSARPSAIEEDKLRFLVEKVRVVSDADMQIIWSRILAGEANAQGSFSRTSMDIVSRMEKEDANSFTRLCAFCFEIGGSTELFMYQPSKEVLGLVGLTWDDLDRLVDLGLVKHSNFDIRGTLIYPFGEGGENKISYFGEPIYLETDKRGVAAGMFVFTRAGRELRGIAGPEANTAARDSVTEVWKSQGWVPTSSQGGDSKMILDID